MLKDKLGSMYIQAVVTNFKVLRQQVPGWANKIYIKTLGIMPGQGYRAGHRAMTNTEQWQNHDWQWKAELGQKRAKCNVIQHESHY